MSRRTATSSTPRLVRRAIRTAMLPSIDQTRTTGIVVLPGAFVGAVFAGASPFEADRFQLVVLAGVLAAGAVTSVILLRLIGGEGAFVGAVFAGASPFEADRFQLVVLAGVLAAGAVTSVILLRLIGGVARRPSP